MKGSARKKKIPEGGRKPKKGERNQGRRVKRGEEGPKGVTPDLRTCGLPPPTKDCPGKMIQRENKTWDGDYQKMGGTLPEERIIQQNAAWGGEGGSHRKQLGGNLQLRGISVRGERLNFCCDRVAPPDKSYCSNDPEG